MEINVTWRSFVIPMPFCVLQYNKPNKWKVKQKLLQLSHRTFPNISQGKSLSFPVFLPVLPAYNPTFFINSKSYLSFQLFILLVVSTVYVASLLKLYRIWQSALLCGYYSPLMLAWTLTIEVLLSYLCNVSALVPRKYRYLSAELRGRSVKKRELLKVSCAYAHGM